jgi:hypothetical protein
MYVLPFSLHNRYRSSQQLKSGASFKNKTQWVTISKGPSKPRGFRTRVDLAAIIVDVFSMICFSPFPRRVVPDRKLFTRARYFAKGLLYENNRS